MIQVLMTAYNEEEALAALLPRIPDRVHGHAVQILLVDDGSTDATAEVAATHGCATIRSPTNRGKGASLQIGFTALATTGYDVLVLMDSDGQHDPGSLEMMTAPILDGTADLVVGSRYLASPGRGNAPWNRYAVRSATVVAINRILSADITDPYSGYRAMSPEAARCMGLVGDRYESELEMIFCASHHQLRLAERPIPKIYGPATSKMGSRHGRLPGRLNVVSRYALTIYRGARGQYGSAGTNKRETTYT